MMKKIRYKKYFWMHKLFPVLYLMCILFTGCRARDATLELILEEAKQETKPDSEENILHGTDVLSEALQSAENMEQSIFVHVCGAVNSPGVVELSQDSRVADALAAAGGFSEEAHTDYVNQAAKLKDGQQLYFPTVEEALFLIEQERSAAGGLVNINTAGEAELCTLPGIGQARAQDIIAYRKENGAFVNTEDIMKVSGIKQSAYDKICDRITVE